MLDPPLGPVTVRSIMVCDERLVSFDHWNVTIGKLGRRAEPQPWARHGCHDRVMMSYLAECIDFIAIAYLND